MSSAAGIQIGEAPGDDYTRLLTPRRWGALVGGGALAIYGLTRRSPFGVVTATAGGVLAYVGVKNTSLPGAVVAQSSVSVNCSAQEAYQFWRKFENLPIFMRHLEAVTESPEGRSTWIALGPLGSRIVWDAEIVNERENELIEWQSLPGSALFVEGSVKFRLAPACTKVVLDPWADGARAA